MYIFFQHYLLKILFAVVVVFFVFPLKTFATVFTPEVCVFVSAPLFPWVFFVLTIIGIVALLLSTLRRNLLGKTIGVIIFILGFMGIVFFTIAKTSTDICQTSNVDTKTSFTPKNPYEHKILHKEEKQNIIEQPLDDTKQDTKTPVPQKESAPPSSSVGRSIVFDNTKSFTAPLQKDESKKPNRGSPSIFIIGNKFVFIPLNTPYSDAGARAFDVDDGNITSLVTTKGLPIDTSIAGTHLITYTVSDSAGNKVSANRQVLITENTLGTLPIIPTPSTSDQMFLVGCIGADLSGACVRADLTSDGKIDTEDLGYFLEKFQIHDLNGDLKIGMEKGDSINSCFLKNKDGGCANQSHPNILFTEEYLTFLGSKIDLSLAVGYEMGIKLDTLKSHLDLTKDIDSISFASLAQYDLNKDGIADFSTGTTEIENLIVSCINQQLPNNCWDELINKGGIADFYPEYINADTGLIRSCFNEQPLGICKNKDINKDGNINEQDLKMLTSITNPLLPNSFTIKKFEGITFDWELYTDKTIINHCVGLSTLLGNCWKADVNSDGVASVEDKLLFISQTKKLDLNQNNIVEF